jgi:uncharacterized protein YkwD
MFNSLHRTFHAMLKPILFFFSLIMSPLLVGQSIAEMYTNVEHPKEGFSYTGIGNITGWSFSTNYEYTFEIKIDDQLIHSSESVGNGTQRHDVYEHFNVAPALNSGFSIRYNFNKLPSGNHTLTYTSCDAEECSINIKHFSTFKFSDNERVLRNDMSFGDAQVNFTQSGIQIDNMIVKGQKYSVVLNWNESTQNFAMIATMELEENMPPPSANYGMDDRDRFLQLINDLRAHGAPCTDAKGLPPLVANQQLNLTALRHSMDMAMNNYFDHTGLNGSGFWDRASDSGYTGHAYGENIAAGSRGIELAFHQWVNSTPHCLTMMADSITEFGYGWAYNANSRWKFYHTLVVGR